MKFGAVSLLFIVICVQLLWIPVCDADPFVDPDGDPFGDPFDDLFGDLGDDIEDDLDDDLDVDLDDDLDDDLEDALDDDPAVDSGRDRCLEYVNTKPPSKAFSLFGYYLWKRGPCKDALDAIEKKREKKKYQKKIEKILKDNWFTWFAVSVSFLG